MEKEIKNLLKKIHELYKNPEQAIGEFAEDWMEEVGKMSWEEFCEFEEEQWEVEKNLGTVFESYKEYLQWVFDDFGNWN